MAVGAPAIRDIYNHWVTFLSLDLSACGAKLDAEIAARPDAHVVLARLQALTSSLNLIAYGGLFSGSQWPLVPRMLRTVLEFLGLLVTMHLLTRDHMLVELALRQQLAAYVRERKRVRVRRCDRLFWVVLSKCWEGWKDVLAIVRPDTVVRWRRNCFRDFWRIRSRNGRPRSNRELRDLIRKMASENNWGAPRIHGELLKLGFDVAERTVSRYLRGIRRRRGKGAATWRAFLNNHREVIAAMDFVVVPTWNFRLLYLLIIIHHDRRRILHVNASEHPTSAWVSQQLRVAFPGDETAPRYLLCDNDSIFSKQVTDTASGLAVKLKRTSIRSPWQNGICERFIGSLRRELLDHVVPLNERHLLRIVREYVAYHHDDRTHLTLEKDTPLKRSVEQRPSLRSKVVALPRIGRLHHRYAWRDAA